jgi:hypothetical protein
VIGLLCELDQSILEGRETSRGEPVSSDVSLTKESH